MSTQAVRFAKGLVRLKRFCAINKVPVPLVRKVEKSDWHVSACAYFRPQTGISICLPLCAHPCNEKQCKNWNWAGSTTDRTPSGVLFHELGHYFDYLGGTLKGSYFSELSKVLYDTVQEKPVSSYCPNEAEWFAEMFRVYVSNPLLLREIRPETYEYLKLYWKHLPSKGWKHELSLAVPPKILKALKNKGAK